MAGRYSPIYSGVWNDDALEGSTFECKAFFVFLWSNQRVRPSGIYRVTDEQLAADTELPVPRVRRYVHELVDRCRIVRDGAWMFVRGYLSRQPKQENLLNGARRDVMECTSRSIREAFCVKYPLYSQWSTDGRPTIDRPSTDLPSRTDLQSSTYRDLPTEVYDDGRPTVAARILNFLNETTGRTYRPVAANLELIRARLQDGATEANCRGVIARKAREWRGTSQAVYLRPKTLFNRTNFEQYLGERAPEAPHAVPPMSGLPEAPRD